MRWTKLNTPEAAVESEVQLSVADLTSWEGWSPPARASIDRQGEAVLLRPVIKRHGDPVVEINAWLLSALAQANVDELAEVNKIVVERNALLNRIDIEEATRLTEEWTPRRETPAPPQDQGAARSASNDK